ncbi:Wzz/FepE/Etk N-terminal domain-containing protein [Hathewaya histolytica]|uniref:Capsular polysaccharide biosynthsis protein n=1 Tax=Hathewaya histolytica TaxID=1498 RepID=A0A4U9RRM0_HATHI|nr:Wzz/FepE/Etk N-terminal domain-containing protein [Hathewaya histolytica]VTQ94739.1 capsular polysaccharide biosynthsis protein [Hathewaya histolytica]
MEQEITIDLHKVSEILVKRKKLIAIITTISLLITGIISFFIIKPTYETKATIVIGKEEEKNDKQNSYNDIMMFQKLVKTYAQIAESRTVIEKVAQKVGNGLTYEKLKGRIKVIPQPDTQIMEIKVLSKKPEEAYSVLNSLGEIFISESKRIYPTGQIEILDKAVVPEKPIKPNKKLNMAIALLLGLFLSTGASFLLEYLDRTLKSEEDIERYLDLPVLAVIPKIEK